MFCATLYLQAFHKALNAFPDLTKNDILVLQELYLMDCTVRYKLLHELITANYGSVLNYSVFQSSLERLVGNEYIKRTIVKAGHYYTITAKGRVIFIRLNDVIERLVKGRVEQYGNGFVFS